LYVKFLQRLFNGVQIDGSSPLKTIAGKQSSLSRHAAQLNNIQPLPIDFRQLQYAFLDIFGRDWMDVIFPGNLNHDAECPCGTFGMFI
jgi:hypothetical protein